MINVPKSPSYIIPESPKYIILHSSPSWVGLRAVNHSHFFHLHVPQSNKRAFPRHHMEDERALLFFLKSQGLTEASDLEQDNSFLLLLMKVTCRLSHHSKMHFFLPTDVPFRYLRMISKLYLPCYLWHLQVASYSKVFVGYSTCTMENL